MMAFISLRSLQPKSNITITTLRRSMFVAAFDVKTPENFLIRLERKEGEAIVERFGGDYDEMVSHLKIVRIENIYLTYSVVKQ